MGDDSQSAKKRRVLDEPGDFNPHPLAAFEVVYPHGIELSQETQDVLGTKSKNKEAITFDEVTLADQPVDFHPNDVVLRSHVTRKIQLKGGGILSAAMDTVTEKELALAVAKMGGMGILHRNLSPEEQADQVKWVRRKIHFGGMIDKPITFAPDQTLSFFQKEVASHKYHFTSFPVVGPDRKMLGLITRDQLEFVEGQNPTLDAVMIPVSKLVTAKGRIDSQKAYQIMSENKVKKLPVLDPEGKLIGMYVWNDVKNDQAKRDRFSLDEDGHFLVGAAIGVGKDDLRRVDLLVDSGCKVIVIDSSHGSCGPVKQQLTAIRQKYGSNVEVIAGNIASYASAMYLLEGDAKPDALKVGIGPGSICTTRLVTGHGIPQITAIFEVWRAVRDHGAKTGYYVPIVADGGIRSSGDIVKCLAAGASAVMIGSGFAGCHESPGVVVEKGGRKYKTIRGMGSRSAMEERSGSRGRYYRQENQHKGESLTHQQAEKLVPEGVEGLVQFKGTVESVMTQLLGGIQAGLAHSGAKSVPEFQSKACFWVQSFAGMVEGKPHDITDIRD